MFSIIAWASLPVAPVLSVSTAAVAASAVPVAVEAATMAVRAAGVVMVVGRRGAVKAADATVGGDGAIAGAIAARAVLPVPSSCDDAGDRDNDAGP
jgi:hypothetical protein